MIVDLTPTPSATKLLELLGEAVGPDRSILVTGQGDEVLIELHDLAEHADTLPIASGKDRDYAVATAKLVANLLAPGYDLVRPACPMAPAEPVRLPRRFGEAHGDDTPPFGIPRLVVERYIGDHIFHDTKPANSVDAGDCDLCGEHRRHHRHVLGEVAS